jgi:hypothetical protein
MSAVVVRGQEYEYYVERDLIVAFALHHVEDCKTGSVHLMGVKALFDFSSDENFDNIEGCTNRVTYIPGSGAVSVTATVTNLKTGAEREFDLGLEMPGAVELDVREEIISRIKTQQLLAERRAVQS